MAKQFPNVSTAQGMRTTGLLNIADYLFTELATTEARIEYLQHRYPNARLLLIENAIEYALESWQAAQSVKAGLIPPNDSRVPVNPSLPSDGTIKWTIIATCHGVSEDPDGDETDFEQHITTTVYTSAGEGLEEATQRAQRAANTQIQVYSVSGRLPLIFTCVEWSFNVIAIER